MGHRTCGQKIVSLRYIFEELVDAIEPVRRQVGDAAQVSGSLRADEADDAKKCCQVLRKRGIKSRIARKGKENSNRLGRHRWVVERTLAWLAKYRSP
jgi:hypothetical protein